MKKGAVKRGKDGRFVTKKVVGVKDQQAKPLYRRGDMVMVNGRSDSNYCAKVIKYWPSFGGSECYEVRRVGARRGGGMVVVPVGNILRSANKDDLKKPEVKPLYKVGDMVKISGGTSWNFCAEIIMIKPTRIGIFYCVQNNIGKQDVWEDQILGLSTASKSEAKPLYKVGDKVEVNYFGGFVGEILAVHGDEVWVEYQMDGKPSNGVFSLTNIKLYQPKPKYAVGDLVLLKDESVGVVRSLSGSEGYQIEMARGAERIQAIEYRTHSQIERKLGEVKGK